MIVLQAAELRIIDQLDNLYLLQDPEVGGEPETINDFSIRVFGEFAAEAIPNEETGIEITALSDDCPQAVKDIRAQLSELSDNIGRAFAYEEWLKDRVKEALATTENEFFQIINDNQARTADAAATVVDAVNQLSTLKKGEGESNEEFAARMKITFDAD